MPKAQHAILFAAVAWCGAAQEHEDVICEMVEGVGFTATFSGYVKNVTKASPAECCAETRASDWAGAWTYETKTKKCRMLANVLTAYGLRAVPEEGVWSGSDGGCSNFMNSDLCVVGKRTKCCDGQGSSLGAGRCYDPAVHSCCQNDLRGVMCQASETCCTFQGEGLQPACCGSALPYCHNRTKTGRAAQPTCAASPPDPLFPYEPFPLTFHTWVVTSVQKGNATDPVGAQTHNFGQLVTFSYSYNPHTVEQTQWSCRTLQQDLMHPGGPMPGDFCHYSSSGGNHSHRPEAGGQCSSSPLTGELPGLFFPSGAQEGFDFVAVDKVNQKMCNHWTWKGAMIGVDFDFWASTDEQLPCLVVQRRASDDGTWEVTTWAFDGFSTQIPEGKKVECQALACGSKPPRCAPKASATDAQLQGALDWTCGAGVDCGPISADGAHYLPNTVRDHAAWAFEAYWLQAEAHGGSCDFGGAAELVPGAVLGAPSAAELVPGAVLGAPAKPWSVFELDLTCVDVAPAAVVV